MSMNTTVVIVAGGGIDIERACAIDLAKQGANIVLTYHASSETALKREGESEEVAKLVTFLASDASSYMTGNCIDINGGLLFS